MMKYLDLTLKKPELNLGLDEALMDFCEEGFEHDILRFWEPTEHFVVVGYSNRIQAEVNITSCHENNIPILRRCSGGGTVLQGPGCLNFSLILKIANSLPLKGIKETNQSIMNRNKEILQPLVGPEISRQGETDLTLGNLKFSGNAQRRKSRFVLFHGTFLLNFDIALIGKHLLMPSKQPSYRQDRSHNDFLTNIPLASKQLKEILRQGWNANQELESIPTKETDLLVRKKYSTQDWNFRY